MKRLIFDLTKILLLKCSIIIYRLIAEVFHDQNLCTELNLGGWFSSYVQFCSGGHFSERAEAARQSEKMNHLKQCIILYDIEIGCSVTIRKTCKQVNLGLFIVISPLFIQFYD